MSDRAAAQARFERHFGPGGRIHAARAPGRVNLIGDHTDYNDGFALPLAVEPHILIICRARDDGQVRVTSEGRDCQTVEFSLNSRIERGQPPWGDYIRGVAAGLIAAGVPLTGMDALLVNTLPVGAGLSSSAAVEVATALALLQLAGTTVDPSRLALICQKAEHDWARVPCGIMDQTAVIHSHAGHAMLLDCRDLSRQYIPIDDQDLRIVIINTMVRHDLAETPYAQRRQECQQGLDLLRRRDPAIRALRDVSLERLEGMRKELPEPVYRRCRHVITENARTVDAAEKFRRRFYDEVGQLMFQSHQSLRDDFDASTAELDWLVDSAMAFKGVYGARMTGAGFGGCVVALVLPRTVEALADFLRQGYHNRFAVDPAIYVTTAAAGACTVA